MVKRYGKKKRARDGDIFAAKVSAVTDSKMEADLMYHIQTHRCPYNRLECMPANCMYGKDGMDKCPIHQGEVM
ncbi:MAG: hypothetical protein HZB92_06885 [Euryarchaeota archaeon]|nr:hypothetical protein [Euryarchaeota archaeon]